MATDEQHPDEQLRDFLAAEHLRLSKPEHPEPRQVPMLNNYLGGIQAALNHLRSARLAEQDRCPHLVTAGPYAGQQCCRPRHRDDRHG